MGKIKLPRYIEYIEKQIEADCIKIKFAIPVKSAKKKLNEDEMTQKDINTTFENWKRRGNSGSNIKNNEKGIFFNKKNMK